MARPCRPSIERELVTRAAAGMRGSARARATRLAREVARETAAIVDREPSDLTDAIVMAQAVLAPSPAFALATLAEIDTAGLFTAARARRYVARGCRQLPDCEWRREGLEVLAEVIDTLARRFRAHL